MSELFPGLARPARFPDVIIGLGASSRATAGEVLALIDAVLAGHDLGRSDVAACATLDRKRVHPALVEAAETLCVPLHACRPEQLASPVPTPSAAVLAHIGLPSVAEAAALAFGPLIAEKRRSANATCALSRQYAIAATAASTLSTSRAGP